MLLWVVAFIELHPMVTLQKKFSKLLPQKLECSNFYHPSLASTFLLACLLPPPPLNPKTLPMFLALFNQNLPSFPSLLSSKGPKLFDYVFFSLQTTMFN
jgi:hypothetical protein